MIITKKVRRFIDEYLIDMSGAKAAVRAGFSARSAGVQACQMLGKPEIAEAIAEAMQARSERVQVDADMVLQRLWQIATANPNDLMQYRRSCCRYCHGKKHAYQWTRGEYTEKVAHAVENKSAVPDSSGGFGFDPTKLPSPKCPECFGDGNGHVHVTDTRRLTGGAALLYAGVKQTKEGLEIKTHNQLDALEKVGLHIGMFKQKHEHSAPGGGPIQARVLSTNMTQEQFAEVARQLLNEV